MILRKTKSLRFNLGNYEHMEVFATCEINLADEPGMTSDEAMDVIDGTLTDFLAPDAEQASAITEKEESAVFPYIEHTSTTTKGKK